MTAVAGASLPRAAEPWVPYCDRLADAGPSRPVRLSVAQSVHVVFALRTDIVEQSKSLELLGRSPGGNRDLESSVSAYVSILRQQGLSGSYIAERRRRMLGFES